MDYYAIYLRKSRADLDAESRGEGETLARHRTALRALAERRGFIVVREYAELVTGDSIAARPQMQALLNDVKRGIYAGVIVNDVDRLGRGDSIDQEIIKYTFVAGNCLIITPTRDINPANPTDEDMLDFWLFFGRFEYRKIAQRLLQGRTRSAASGNYISPRVPYGYRKVVDGKKITLEVDEQAAENVRMIFEWYASRKYGYNAIAQRLNEMGIKTYRGYPFSRVTIRNMLKNPIYTGRIVWGRTVTISAIEDGKRIKKHIDATPQVAENAHPAIISEELFAKVQKMFDESQHAYPAKTNAKLVNPLAGLIYCAECGHALELRGGNKGRNQDRVLTCVNTNCPTRGTYIGIILEAVLEILQSWCADYREPEPEEPTDDSQVKAAERQIAMIEAQITKAQELVELGIYTPSEYVKRKEELQRRTEAARNLLEEARHISTKQSMHALVPAIESVLDAFPMAQTVEQQNRLLQTIVSRIEYSKTEVATKSVNARNLMQLKVFPKIEKAGKT